VWHTKEEPAASVQSTAQPRQEGRHGALAPHGIESSLHDIDIAFTNVVCGV